MRRLMPFLQKHEALLIILVIVILLRIPNLFEPYWYGDEAIYLTVGAAMRNGAILYKNIIDHKTPVIYIFAMVPSEFWFKFLFLNWMVAATSLFYSICLRLFSSKTKIIFGVSIFALLTTLPWFEGHIANGELFVMGFILAGIALFVRSSLFAAFEKNKTSFAVEPFRMFLVGIFMSLGILTKIPAIFDVAAIAPVFGFVFLRSLNWKNFRSLLSSGVLICIGILVPIALSIAYFASQRGLNDYAQFGFLYNFRYSKEFSIPVTQSLVQFLFTMPGKLLIVGLFSFATFIFQKFMRPMFRFVLLWFVLSLFASLLSSRPYPHYFLQMLPPFSLLAVALLSKNYIVEKLAGVSALFLGIATLFLLHVGLYSVRDYYTNFFQFATHRISATEYRNRFNPLMDDTYTVAQNIRETTKPKDKIFIWGTDPMLYALSRRDPAGRFTVSFHIKDFNAYQETMVSIEQTKPPVIVLINDENGKFDAFYAYLQKNYVTSQRLSTMTIYRRVVWK